MRGGALVLCLIFSLWLITSVQATPETFYVYPYKQVTIKIELEKGKIVNGNVSVTGEGNDYNISFYVTDPNNRTILSYGNTSFRQLHAFSFTASMAGNYTLHFDNSRSAFFKDVTLGYSIETPTSGIPLNDFYVILAIIIIAATTTVVAIVLRRRRSSKGQTKRQTVEAT